jgi:hypothetical protein
VVTVPRMARETKVMRCARSSLSRSPGHVDAAARSAVRPTRTRITDGLNGLGLPQRCFAPELNSPLPTLHPPPQEPATASSKHTDQRSREQHPSASFTTMASLQHLDRMLMGDGDAGAHEVRVR